MRPTHWLSPLSHCSWTVSWLRRRFCESSKSTNGPAVTVSWILFAYYPGRFPVQLFSLMQKTERISRSLSVQNGNWTFFFLSYDTAQKQNGTKCKYNCLGPGSVSSQLMLFKFLKIHNAFTKCLQKIVKKDFPV